MSFMPMAGNGDELNAHTLINENEAEIPYLDHSIPERVHYIVAQRTCVYRVVLKEVKTRHQQVIHSE